MPSCPLCSTQGIKFHEDHRTFYACNTCHGIFTDIDSMPTRKEEHDRYETHNNDINDIGYQTFVSPIVDFIKGKYSKKSLGLDYGAGPGPVIYKLLTESGYSKLEKYDPFYFKDKSVLHESYDYIICCEVIEHFHRPREEFRKLFRLLKNKGDLVCMTHLYDESIPFENWYYKNDPTHVFFYSKSTVIYIAENFGFKDYTIDGRLVIFQKVN